MPDNGKNEMAALLKQAIKSEIDGFTFYDLLAKQTENEEARRRLTDLRNDESRHRKILMEMYKDLIGGDIGALPEEGVSVLEKAFDTGQLKKLNSEVEYINLAIEAELAASKFYKETSGKVENEEFKKLLMEMSDEENGHYEWLMAEREAMAGNYFWFSMDGSSPMED
jgi:rubrerythrin